MYLRGISWKRGGLLCCTRASLPRGDGVSRSNSRSICCTTRVSSKAIYCRWLAAPCSTILYRVTLPEQVFPFGEGALDAQFLEDRQEPVHESLLF